MSGYLGYLRGATRCLLCGGDHGSASVSFGIYGSVSICPGHPLRLDRAAPRVAGADEGASRMISEEIIGRSQGK